MASVLGVEPSELYKTARSVTLVGDLAPANASISICVRRLLEGPISGAWVGNGVGGEVCEMRRTWKEERSSRGPDEKAGRAVFLIWQVLEDSDGSRLLY